jgi:hypothetical protein
VACGCGPDGPPTPFYVDLTQVFAISAAVKNGAKVHLSGWRPKTAKSSFAGTTIHSARGERPSRNYIAERVRRQRG